MNKKRQNPFKQTRTRNLNIPLKRLKLGKPLHELTPDQASKLETIYEICGHVQDENNRPTTLEDFQRAFMCDQYPDKEISVWCRIALAYQKYTQTHQPQIRKEAQKILNTLIILSIGMDNRILPEQSHTDLKQCFYNPLR